MDTLRRKLHRSTGASMLLGLLFLLFCLTVGAVVLTAASVSAGRTQRNRQVQQNYLAVQSAANLLMDDLANWTYQASYTYQLITTAIAHYDAEGNYTGTTYKKEYKYGEPFTAELTGGQLDQLQKMLEGYCKALFFSSKELDGYRKPGERSDAPAHVPVSFTLYEQEGTSGTPHGLPSVTVDLTLGWLPSEPFPAYAEAGYTVTAEVHLTETGPEGDHKMTVRFTPTVNTTTEQKSEGGNPVIDTTTITTTVTWKADVVTKGAATWEN